MASLATLNRTVQPYARALFDYARALGLNPRVTSARRSRAMQARLYRQWVQGISRFPAAKPGTSLHELGGAFDLTVDTADGLRHLGKVWESWGFTWGGRFKDPIHFDVRPK